MVEKCNAFLFARYSQIEMICCVYLTGVHVWVKERKVAWGVEDVAC